MASLIDFSSANDFAKGLLSYDPYASDVKRSNLRSAEIQQRLAERKIQDELATAEALKEAFSGPAQTVTEERPAPLLSIASQSYVPPFDPNETIKTTRPENSSERFQRVGEAVMSRGTPKAVETGLLLAKYSNDLRKRLKDKVEFIRTIGSINPEGAVKSWNNDSDLMSAVGPITIEQMAGTGVKEFKTQNGQIIAYGSPKGDGTYHVSDAKAGRKLTSNITMTKEGTKVYAFDDGTPSDLPAIEKPKEFNTPADVDTFLITKSHDLGIDYWTPEGRQKALQWLGTPQGGAEFSNWRMKTKITVNAPSTSQIDTLAQGILDGTIDPNGISKRGGLQGAVWTKVKQLDPNFNIVKAGAGAKYEGSSQTMQTKTLLNTIDPLLDKLEIAGAALENSNTPGYNRARNYLLEQTGDPGIVGFNNLRDAVIAEVERGLLGTGVLTDSKYQRELRNVHSAQSLPQLKAAVKNIRTVIAARLEAVNAGPNAGQKAGGTGQQPTTTIRYNAKGERVQ
jgi:hypothetical protein